MKKLARAKRTPAFPERLRTLRGELGWTRTEFKKKLDGRYGAASISLSTLIKMEKAGKESYQLPRRPGKSPSMIEMVAATLSVDIGYLLAGFSKPEIEESIFDARVKKGEIRLLDDLAPRNKEPFTDFLKSLPAQESDLLSLNMLCHRNERAFAVISRIERMFSGLEWLVVNEPPLIFWDDEDVRFWARNMQLDETDSIDLTNEFSAYRQHFQRLVKNKDKIYRVVLKLHTLRKFLEHKAAANIAKQINNMIDFLDYESFNMVLLEREVDQSSRGDNEFDEYEIISKHKDIPWSLEDSLSVQIQQTPPDHTPAEYFVTPLHPGKFPLQRDKARIENLWAKALDQYRLKFPDMRQTFTEKRQREASKELLQELRYRKIGL